MRLNILTKFLFLLFLPYLSQAADELVIYPVKYRTAEELIKVAEPLFYGRATFSSLNEKIVISAPQKTVDAVLKLFKELDRRPRMYRISVRLISRAFAEQEALAMEAAAARQRASISKRSGVLSRQGTGSVGVGGVNASAESNSQQSAGNTDQSVEVLEGKEARLLQGSTFFPGGFIAKVNSGGKSAVTLNLNQREGNANPAVSLSSEITLKLGEWRTVGQSSQNSTQSRGEILGKSQGGSDSTKVIQVKVDSGS